MKFYDKHLTPLSKDLQQVVVILIVFVIGFLAGYFTGIYEKNNKESITEPVRHQSNVVITTDNI